MARAAPLLTLRPLLVVTDFDGTVAVPRIDPWAADILPTARRALRDLAGQPGVAVAFLSGRTATDLVGRARVGGAAYLGNHGLERGDLARHGRPARLHVDFLPVGDGYTTLAERLAEQVPRLVPEPWLIVEPKGPAVTFHFRGTDDVAAAGRRVAAAVDQVDAAQAMVRFPGRRALELRPPGAPGKGDAMRALLTAVRPAAAISLGDDRSDTLAFGVLAAARAEGRCATLSVAVLGHPDAPNEIMAAADVVLASPADAARFLARVASKVSRGR